MCWKGRRSFHPVSRAIDTDRCDSCHENAAGLLQAKAANIGIKRAVAAIAPHALVIARLTIEATGTMLLGSEIGAALTALEPTEI